MNKHEKTKEHILSGTSFANVHFDDLCGLLTHLGFGSRVTASSHHIFTREGVSEIINLQPGRDGKAKPYQVRQVRALIIMHNL
jgi:hypothetical protein